MSISVPPRDLEGALRTRQARPLNGIEVAEAVSKHILVLSDQLLSREGLLSDVILPIIEATTASISAELSKHSRLTRSNLSYPKVGWSIKTRLGRLEDQSYVISGEVELDLVQNVRLHIRFGPEDCGNIVGTLDDEKIPNSIPDRDRRNFGLPVTADYYSADGTVKKVDIDQFRAEKRASRTIDVGSGASDTHQISPHMIVKEKTIPASLVGEGERVVLPSELPEITLEDVVATPPVVEKAPPEKPLPPPGGMNRVTAPKVKFKR